MEEDCADLYLGDFTKCAETSCPPIGACCTLLGFCSDGTQEECTGCPPSDPNCPQHNGATYQGDGTTCSTDPCGSAPPTGACCMQDGNCEDNTVEDDCFAATANYQGDDTLCINVTCEQPQWPTGACCLMDATCQELTASECLEVGFSYQGDDTACTPDLMCGVTGACCMAEGGCEENQDLGACVAMGGDYQGDATICSPNPCVQPEAACCDDFGACQGNMRPAACTLAGGTYQGGGTMCASYDCSVTGACCLPGETCEDITAASCAFQAGLYAGDPSSCPIDCSVDDDGGAAFGTCQATERTLLFADDAGVGHEFGTVFSLSGSLALVGAPGNGARAAYVLELDNPDCGIGQTKLTPSGPQNGLSFGAAVSLSGDTAVVLDPGADRAGQFGVPYVFQKPPLGWQEMYETAALSISDPGISKFVAESVAINEGEDVIVVGHPADCEDPCVCDPIGLEAGCGSVYVYHRRLFGWEDRVEDSILTGSDSVEFDRFGEAVSISGSAVLIGAPGQDDPCGGGINCDAGAAYVMRSNATGWNWLEEAKLIASDAAVGDEFGSAVSIKGDVALIGSPLDDEGAESNAGSAYVFRFDPQSGQWNQEARLTASDGLADDQFGSSVAISGDTAIIGAKFDDDPGTSGSAYVFYFDGFDWNEQAKFTASDASLGDLFGISVSLSGERAIVGADRGEAPGFFNSGAVYIFDGLGDCDDTDTADICDIINDPSLDCCPPPDCCEARRELGCSESGIEGCVCAQMPDCCNREWTTECVDLVEGGTPVCGSCHAGNGIIDACEGCVADLNGDGVVDPTDLSLLLVAWGECSGACPADLNGDCDVGPTDLAILLVNWGPCPEEPGRGGASLPGGGARRFVLGGGGSCLPLEDALQMMGYETVGEFIDWVLSSVPADMVYQVAQFLLWLLEIWPC